MPFRQCNFSHFDTIHQCDGQTDGQTRRDGIYRANFPVLKWSHTRCSPICSPWSRSWERCGGLGRLLCENRNRCYALL